MLFWYDDHRFWMMSWGELEEADDKDWRARELAAGEEAEWTNEAGEEVLAAAARRGAIVLWE